MQPAEQACLRVHPHNTIFFNLNRSLPGRARSAVFLRFLGINLSIIKQRILKTVLACDIFYCISKHRRLPLMINIPSSSYNKLFENAPAALYTTLFERVDFHCNIIDINYRIIWHNRMAEEKRKPGLLCFEFYMKRNQPCMICPVRNVVDSGEISVVERERLERLPNGLPTWGEIRAFPIFDKNGDVEAVFTIGFDVTEKRLQLEKHCKDISVLERRILELSKLKSIMPADGGENGFNLSIRELQVLNLLVQGFSNREISKILSLSVHTVKTHVNHIFNKLGVNDRTEAATLATRLKLL
jgi:DNA-binding CsgD family transcriptional regulator